MKFLLALLLSIAPLVSLGSVSVSPVVMRSEASNAPQVVRVTNSGKEPVSFQVSVFSWHQDGLVEQEEKTREVLAYPSILEVAPGMTRSIRLMKARLGDGNYRVLIQQLPKPNHVAGIQVLTDYNLTLIFESGVAPIQMVAQRQGDKLVLSNMGSRVFQVTSIGGVGVNPWKEGMLGWLLPGGSVAYPYAAPDTIQVTADRKIHTIPVQ